MGAVETGSIKYIEPMRRAWERMVVILFRPFSMGKWFALGFSAWLATFTSVTGNSFSYNSSGGDSGGGNGLASGQFSSIMDQYAPVIIAIVAVIAIFMIIFGVLLFWLQARGHFMFLDNVITNRSLIKRPWREFKRQGNSLFLWNIAIVFITLMLIGMIFVILLISLWPCIHHQGGFALAVIGGSVAVFLTLLFIVTGLYVGCFLNDFVSPIMRVGNLSVIPAWRRFLKIFKENPGVFLLYGLFKTGVMMVVETCVLILMVVTCCFCCFILVPYLGTVLMLPVLVFCRALGPEFLAQFGVEFELPSPEVLPPPCHVKEALPSGL
jgi:hypothetical protein